MMETVIFKSYCFESESFKELTEILVIIENNLSSRHFQKLLVIFENYVFSKFTLTYPQLNGHSSTGSLDENPDKSWLSCGTDFIAK